jgi:hypothetical protein
MCTKRFTPAGLLSRLHYLPGGNDKRLLGPVLRVRLPTTDIAAAKIRTRTALAICERWFIRGKIDSDN